MVNLKSKISKLTFGLLFVLTILLIGGCDIVVKQSTLAIEVETNIVAGRYYDFGISADSVGIGSDYTWTVSDPTALEINTQTHKIRGLKEGRVTLTVKTDTNASAVAIIEIAPADKYNIEYELDGGSLIDPVRTFTVFDEVTLPVPTREGFVFGGWYKNAQHSGQSVTKIAVGSTADVKVYALWIEKTYSIIYYLNGGYIQGLVVRYGLSSLPLPLSTPTRGGAIFVGWHNNAALEGNPFLELAVGTTGDLSLYAEWELIDYQATLIHEGVEIEVIDYNCETDDIELPTFEREGYEFLGWFDNPELDGEGIFVLEKGSYEITTLYSAFAAIEYEITYELNGGEAELVESYTIEDEFTLPIPAKDGYKFLGWYDNEEFDGDAIVEIELGSTGELSFYAKWEIVEYSIDLYVDGVLVDTITYTVEDEIALPEQAKDGYAFLGWFDNDEFDGEAIEAIEAGSFGDLELYANFEVIAYEIGYELNGGSSEELVESYTIEDEITLAVPTRLGYTFLGWFDNADFEGDAIVEIALGSIGDVQLYASWEVIEYEITLTLDGVLYETIKYTVEDEIVLPVEELDGYLFLGWYDNDEYTGQAIDVIAAGTTGDIELFAKLVEIVCIAEIEVEGEFILGAEVSVSAIITPEPEIPYTIVWSVEGDAISIDEYGKITILGLGNAKIILTIQELGIIEELEIEVEFGPVANVYVGAEVAGKVAGDIIDINGKDYYVGINAFETLAAALAAVEANGTVILGAGDFAGATITKAVTILGNNANVDPNKETRNPETYLTSNLNVNASGVTINGIAFVGTAKIQGLTTIALANLWFGYLLIDARSTLAGNADAVINIETTVLAATRTNVTITNSKFEKTALRRMGLYASNVINLTITNNGFYGSNALSTFTDCIKINAITGGFALSGEVLVDNNHFSDYGQYILWFRSYGPGNYTITNNNVVNCGQKDYHSLVVMIPVSNKVSAGTYRINVMFNKLDACYSIARIGTGGADAANIDMEVHVNYNIMINPKDSLDSDCAGWTPIYNNEEASGEFYIDGRFNYFGKTPIAEWFSGVKGWDIYFAELDQVPTVLPDYEIEAIENLEIGDILQLNVITNMTYNYPIMWESSDNDTVLIDSSGTIIVKQPGTVTIKLIIDMLQIEIELEVTVNAHEVTDAIVSKDTLYLNNGEAYIYRGKLYIVGVDAFASINEAVAASVTGVVRVLEGEYTENISINKPTTILGPNANINPNTQVRKAEAKIIGIIAVGANDVTINGIELTGASKVRGRTTSSTTSNFHFIYNYVHDTATSSVAWAEADVASAVILIGQSGAANRNHVISYNRFSNIPDGVIRYCNIRNLTVEYNVFASYKLDAIRFDAGGFNDGNINIDHNEFVQPSIGYGNHAVMFRSYSSGSSSDVVPTNVSFTDNYCYQVGNPNAAGGIYTGVFSTRNYQEFGANFAIKNNIFEHCNNYLRLRNNRAASSTAVWSAVVEGNAFIGLPQSYYHANWSGTDSATSNPLQTVFGQNYYEDNDGNPILDLEDALVAGKFLQVASKGTALTSINGVAPEVMTQERLEAELQNVIDSVPQNIVTNYLFPNSKVYGVNITWAYKAGEDTSIHNITTGKHNKLILSLALRTLVVTATYGSMTTSVEVTVNFGVVNPGEKPLFYRQSPASMTADEPQSGIALLGWSGYTVSHNGYVAFVANGNYKEVSTKAALLAMTTGSLSWGSCGALVKFTGTEEISFQKSECALINANYAGVVIRNGLVNQASVASYTLQPGDYLWVPLYLDNYVAATGVVEIGLGKVANFTVGQPAGVNYYLGEPNPQTYSIDYNLDGSTNNAANPKSYTSKTLPIFLEDPYKEDHKFIGWFDTSDFSGDPITMLDVNTRGDIVLYALFEKGTPVIKYLITLKTNGGTMEDYPKFYTSVDTESTLLPFISRENFRFLGWYENEDFSGNPVTEITLGTSGNKTYYAKWVEIIPQGIYTVKFELNGGVFGYLTRNEMIEAFLTDFYNYLDEEGYLVAGTTLDEFLRGPQPSGTWSNPNEFAFGKWVLYIPEETYSGLSAVYGTRDKNHLKNSSSKLIDDEAGMFLNSSKYHDKWLPFFDWLNAMVVAVNGEQGFYSMNDVGSYRLWQLIGKTATSWAGKVEAWFLPNASANFAPNFDRYTAGVQTFNLLVPVRSGYSFEGWFDNPEFVGAPITYIGLNDLGNKVYYAKWSPITENVVTVGIGGDYSTLEEALQDAVAGSIIVLLAGEYDEEVEVTVNNVTIKGAPEAILKGTITVKAGINNFELSGITLLGQVIASDTQNIVIRDLTIAGNDNNEIIVLGNVVYAIIAENRVTLEDAQVFVAAQALNGLYFTDNEIVGGLAALTAELVEGAIYIAFNIVSDTLDVPFQIKQNNAPYLALIANEFNDSVGAIAIEHYGLGDSVNGEVIIQYNTFTGVKGAAVLNLTNENSIPETWRGLINFNAFLNCEAGMFVEITENSIPNLIEASHNFLSDLENEIAKFEGCGELAIADCIANKNDLPILQRNGIVPIIKLAGTGVQEEMTQFDYAQINLAVTPLPASNQAVVYATSNKALATVSDTGLIYALATGTVSVSITSVADPTKNYVITFSIVAPTRVEIFTKGKNTLDNNVLEVGENVELEYAMYFALEEDTVEWSSSDETVVSVIDGVVTAVAEGTAYIRATIVGTEVYTEVGFTVVEDAGEFQSIVDFVIAQHETTIISKNAIVTGYQFVYNKLILGSVSKLFFGTTNVTEYIAPINDDNRPGIIQRSTEYVTIHDTASSAQGANAASHASYVFNGGGGTSWQYSIGNDGIYHQIPDNEVAYHAGDGSRQYALDKTNVPVTVAPKDCVIALNASGYYVINGTATSLRPYSNNGDMVTFDNTIYTTAQIADNGIQIIAGEDGFYYLGKTYYNSSFRIVANTGGNRNSIGIETMVNQGSDIYLTWQRTAKHAAGLCITNGLTPDRVRPHNFFSGKNCPQTMRDNGLWVNFTEMVEAEYELATSYKDYKLSITSNSPTYVDNIGRVIQQPQYTVTVSFTITITKGAQSITLELFSVIPGKYR